MKNSAFHFADWQVDPATNTILRGAETRRMEPRAMDVLVLLCSHAGEVVGTEQLLEQCWGSTVYGDNPIHKTITQLRTLLGDNTKSPLYIETIRKRGYRAIGAVRELDAHIAAKVTLIAAGQSPFRGLQSFGEDDAAVFFGRTEACRQLQQALAAQRRAGQALVLVLGPSGSGKTSLVRAGLLPALLQQGDAAGQSGCRAVTLDLAEVGDHGILTALAATMLDWQSGEASLFPGESSVSLAARLEQEPVAVIAQLQGAVAGAGMGAGPALALFIDRFEALFAQPAFGEADRRGVIELLDGLARSGAVDVIIACRNDFYPHLVVYPALMEGKTHGGHFDLSPPAPAEIAQMIRLPALAAGLRFGSDPISHARLDDVLCQSAGASPDALPLLQYTLQELYRLRGEDNELRFDVLQHLGGMDGAIGQRAEEVIAGLSKEQAAALPRVLSLLLTLSEADDAVTARRAPWSALGTAAERELVMALVDTRLFVSELVDEAPGFGVAHEALLRRWPRVTAWIAEHRHSLRVRSRISLLATRWVAEQRSGDLLLPRGKQLDEALSLLGGGAILLSAEEQALIEASAGKARRRERLRLAAIGLIVGLALLVTVLGISAMGAKRVAQQRRVEAEGLMGFMLGDFADKLRPLGRLDLLDSISSKALEYLSDSDGADMNDTSLRQRAKALELIGELRVTRADPVAAMEALTAAHAILSEQHRRHARDADVLMQLGANAFWRGQIRLNENNYDEAATLFGQYQHYSDLLFALDPNNVDAWIEQSYAHNNLGTVALRRKDIRRAAEEFLLSVELKTRALAQRPADRTLAAELADSYSWVGLAKEMLGEVEAARQLYRRELALARPLYDSKPSDSMWANRVARALQHQAELSLALGQTDAAAQDFRQARDILRLITERVPGNRSWQFSLALAELQLLHISAGHDPDNAVLAGLEQVSQKIGELSKLDPKRADWARGQAVTRQFLARALLARGLRGRAESEIGQATERLEQLFSNNPTDGYTRQSLAGALMAQADIQAAGGDSGAAHATCLRTSALLQGEVGNSVYYRILDPWVRAQHCLGQDAMAANARAALLRIGYQEFAFKQFLFSTR